MSAQSSCLRLAEVFFDMRRCDQIIPAVSRLFRCVVGLLTMSFDRVAALQASLRSSRTRVINFLSLPLRHTYMTRSRAALRSKRSSDACFLFADFMSSIVCVPVVGRRTLRCHCVVICVAPHLWHSEVVFCASAGRVSIGQ